MSAAPVPTAASVPPQNLEAEESVLGAMMMSPGAIIAVREVLDEGDFYRESHGRIYRAALALHDAGEPVDAITLTNALEQRGDLETVGGRTRLHELARLVPASANARHYAEIVRDTATLRGLIRAGGEIAQLGWDREGDIHSLLDRARRITDELERGNLSGRLEAQTWAEFERDATEHIPLLVEGLWPEGGLGFIAAPPKKGKTWVGLDLAIAVATGTPFLGRFDVGTAQPVVVAALEGHKAAIRGRIGCLTRGHGLNPTHGSTDLQNLHLLYKPPGLNLTDPAWMHAIHELVKRIGARLLIVDVLRAAAVIKENSNDEFRDLVRTLQPITTDGCALALLHHFGKLTELSRDRSPGERMSGAGAMYGAFDVGVFITGSDEGGRRLRVEFEARDLPAPEQIGVHLAGEPNGVNGGFIFTDTASWVEQVAPDEDDLTASPRFLYALLEQNDGTLTAGQLLSLCEASGQPISDRTLRARDASLERLGVIILNRPGKPKVYRIITPERSADPIQETLELTEIYPGSDPGSATPEVSGVPGSTAQPCGFAATPEVPEVEAASGVRNGDMQGFSTPETPTSPTERQAELGSAALRESPADDIDFT